MALLTKAVTTAALVAVSHEYRKDMVFWHARQFCIFFHCMLSLLHCAFILAARHMGMAVHLPVKCMWNKWGPSSPGSEKLVLSGTIGAGIMEVVLTAIGFWLLCSHEHQHTKRLRVTVLTICLATVAASVGTLITVAHAFAGTQQRVPLALPEQEKNWVFGQVMAVLLSFFFLIPAWQALRKEVLTIREKERRLCFFVFG